MRSWLVVVALAGCNQVFGLEPAIPFDAAPDADLRPDLDDDNIADVEDLCIASPADEAFDYDGDGKLDGTDPCPYGADPTDDDSDGLPNECDAWPRLAGDRH